MTQVILSVFDVIAVKCAGVDFFVGSHKVVAVEHPIPHNLNLVFRDAVNVLELGFHGDHGNRCAFFVRHVQIRADFLPRRCRVRYDHIQSEFQEFERPGLAIFVGVPQLSEIEFVPIRGMKEIVGLDDDMADVIIDK